MAKQTYIKRDLIDYVKGGVEAPEESYAHRPDWVIYSLLQSNIGEKAGIRENSPMSSG